LCQSWAAEDDVNGHSFNLREAKNRKHRYANVRWRFSSDACANPQLVHFRAAKLM
jgi:hypothetical protein